MRVLLETNVLVRAILRNDSPAREVLLQLRSEPHVLIFSTFIITELYRVLTYPRVRERATASQQEIQELLSSLEAIAEIVDPDATPLVLSADPDDNPIIQTAAIARADVLCTLDRHFQHSDVLEFCRQHRIRIVDDVQLLDELRNSGSQQPA